MIPLYRLSATLRFNKNLRKMTNRLHKEKTENMHLLCVWSGVGGPSLHMQLSLVNE